MTHARLSAERRTSGYVTGGSMKRVAAVGLPMLAVCWNAGEVHAGDAREDRLCDAHTHLS
jgi:hypothetical protein